MNPRQKIKREIMLQFVASCKDAKFRLDDEDRELLAKLEPGITAEAVDEQWESLYDHCQDYISEIRSGQVETKIPCDSSRHYSSKSVAMKTSDGSWIGWTYWFGGGKYGDPDAIDWMKDAYEVEMTEVMEVVQKFKKVNNVPK